MRFRRGATLDAGQVSDRRGMSTGTIGGVAGGGGVIGLVIVVLVMLMNGGGGNQFAIGGTEGGDLTAECRTGEDANQSQDCRVVGVVNSVQTYWDGTVQNYRDADTVLFAGQTSTGCGSPSGRCC